MAKNILTGTSGDPHILRLLPAYILNEGHVDRLERRIGEDIRMKRFIDLADFSREQVLDLLALAQALQDKPEPRALAGKILGLVFFNPSLRTLASFQAGMARLGGSVLRDHPRPGNLAAGDPAQRHHERRGRRTHPRGHSGAGLVLRRAGRARLCRRQESRQRILTRRCSA